MSSYCINLNPLEPMTCIKISVQKSLYYCWLIDNSIMLFNSNGINKDNLYTLIRNKSFYTPDELINYLSKYGFCETSCLYLTLVDSKVDSGRIYTEMYEAYKERVLPTLLELNNERKIDDKVKVRYKYNMGFIGCSCTVKPFITLPPPPFPIEQKSHCICIKYKGKTIHYVSNTSLSNLLVENVLRNSRIKTINDLIDKLLPILMQLTDIGVLNGVIG